MATEQEKTNYKKTMAERMNPMPAKDFDPNTWEPTGREPMRDRVSPPKTLPTHNIKPKEIYEGQMIGMYESKQDLYLIFAHKCNDLQQQIDDLKKLIK